MTATSDRAREPLPAPALSEAEGCPTVTRLLIISNDVIGPRCAGPGLRALAFARVLRPLVTELRLLAPGTGSLGAQRPAGALPLRGGPDEPGLEGVACEPWTPRGLRRALDWAEVCLSQGLGYDMGRLLAFRGHHIFDLYDPILLEELAQRDAAAPAAQDGTGRPRPSPAARPPIAPENVRQQVRMLCRRGDFFVCASARQRDLWLGHLAHEGRLDGAGYRADPTARLLIDVVPFGLDEQPPVHTRPALRGVVAGLGADDVIVLWAGGIYNWLDATLAVRAVARLAAAGRTNLKLVFLGTRHPHPGVPPMAEAHQARRLAAERGVLDRAVFFLDGWVPHAERANYLLEADLGLVLHRDTLETRFAFRTRNLDCLWAGLPIVASAGDVFADWIAARDWGRVVPPGDEEALAAALAALADDAAERRRIGARCRAAAAEFTWARGAAPIAAYLARRHPPPRHRPWADRLALVPYYAAKARFFARTGGVRLVAAKAAGKLLRRYP